MLSVGFKTSISSHEFTRYYTTTTKKVDIREVPDTIDAM